MPAPLASEILRSLNREVINQLDLAAAVQHPDESGRAREQIISRSPTTSDRMIRLPRHPGHPGQPAPTHPVHPAERIWLCCAGPEPRE